ncbi:MAG: bifunctional UDP-N-acetylmuramoyl-tripeptide:D-alanyl-D-alanine ligase/alanine racemase [Sphingobacteriales bacterium]|nr:MAG: bifunctional UDP-N-acetylmuramoyl-tripeptide:D-alanyl-D-alanine ligase/alanine racemase [Sphingobacteriales bacterium]
MYTIEQVAGIVKGKLQAADNSAVIEHLLLDSRKLVFPANTLFFSIKGPRRDGHQYLQELVDKGVTNFVIHEAATVQLPTTVNILVVKDTQVALQALAAYHRKQFNYPVIGITGSNGKTIVKEWLNQLLAAKYAIVRSPKSYNSQIGVPLSVWQMSTQYRLGIFEAGISQSGEMEKLEKIIQPEIGIFTNVGDAHSEGFLNSRQKVKEKLQLFKHAKTLIYCSDYPEINEGVADLVQRLRNDTDNKINLFSWSIKVDATLKIVSLLKDEQHTYITALYHNEEVSLKIPFTDDAAMENAINCWCLLLHLNIDSNYIEQQMAQLAPVAMRLELKKGINNCSIINDSYSADISSFKIALDFLAQQQQHSRKTVILSDILESGKTDKQLYETVVKLLLQKNISRFISIGAQLYRQRSLFNGIPSLEVHHYETMDAFKKDFYNLSFHNETILLKGARIFAFEKIVTLLEQKMHQTVLEINLTALQHNLKQYQQILQPHTKIMAMVKAFSYGSGSYEIANFLQFQKIDYLAVAYADEGVELRKAGISLPIMVMNAELTTFHLLTQFQLEPALYSFEILQAFNQFLETENYNNFPVHIELETGMNRLGFLTADAGAVALAIVNSNCKVQSVFSHLAASEDPKQDAFTKQQAWLFGEACETLKLQLGYSFIKHISNTAGISRHPNLQLDMVRLGIGMYGIDANPQLNLKETTTLKTTIAQIKHLRAGESVSYGHTAIVKRDSVIATVRLGYADGYNRRFSNGIAQMLIKNKPAATIGVVCMDMTMLDITDMPGIKEGDEVIVFGPQLSVKQLAQWAGTIPYEIMSSISQRVKRVYYEE